MRRTLFLAPKAIKETVPFPRYSEFRVSTDPKTHSPTIPTRKSWSLSKMAQLETHPKGPLEDKNDTLTPNSRMSRSKPSPKRIAREAKTNAHRDLMTQLETDLKDLLKEKAISDLVLRNRSMIRDKVERALQNAFGSHLSVQSVGLEHIGAGILYAPVELTLELKGQSASTHSSEKPGPLYDLGVICQALVKADIDAAIWDPPRWSRSEHREPAGTEQIAIIGHSLGFILYPPSSQDRVRLSLIDEHAKTFPSMRNVLASFFFLLSIGTHSILPPYATSAVAHLLLAYYQHKYIKTAPNSRSTSTEPTAGTQTPDGFSPVPFHSRPSDILPSNRKLDTSSNIESPVSLLTLPTSSSEDLLTRQKCAVAYDLLEFLKWWDELLWDKHIIIPTSPGTLSRDIDIKTVSKSMPWDIQYSPLVIRDSVNQANNLASLFTMTQYADMRRFGRVLGRGLRSGMRLELARSLVRPLLYDRATLSPGVGYVRGYATETTPTYGDNLTDEMFRLYQSTRPSAEVQRRRNATMNHLREALQKVGKQFSPELFGSSRYGVGDGRSDMDIVIIDPSLQEGFHPSVKAKSLHRIYQLRPLSNAMQSKFDKIVLIPKAKVPIIKARDPATGLLLDININDRLGLYNTELLSHYCKLWPPLANLVYVVKKWAKLRGLNDAAGPRTGGGPTFSSYCLTLMVIGFLQTHGILPNLQDSKYANELRELERNRGWKLPRVFWIRNSPTVRVRADVYWYPLPPENWRPVSYPSLGRAFYTWLLYFGHDHKYDEFALRIAEGGIVPRRTKKTPQRKVAKSENEASSTPGNNEPLEGDDEDNMAQIEAVTDDLQISELEAARAQAEEMAAQDAKFDDEIKGHISERKSQLHEPGQWANSAFVVGDPFIYEKNCASSISRVRINDFIAECQETIRLIDKGESLSRILTDETLVVSKAVKKKKQKKKKARKEAQEEAPIGKAVAPPPVESEQGGPIVAQTAALQVPEPEVQAPKNASDDSVSTTQVVVQS